MNGRYDSISAYYDRLNGGMDYGALFSFCTEAYSRFGNGGERPLALDLGCGTGSLTKLLSSRFDMTAMDINEEMLAVARAKCDGGDVLFVRGDMRGFELYGSVAAVFSTCDCVNYLLSEKELTACFSCVRNYLDPGGIFVFDAVTKHRFETFYANNTYAYDEGDVFLVWENDYRKSGICDFALTLFVKCGNGWTRIDDAQRQRAYSVSTVKKAAERSGLSVAGVYGGTDFSPLTPDSDRAYFICRREN
ncbi:MAG: class I SAM-dependent methyltransferase [Clostridia bacterium]|nr:class I SAM-dependent methyltransferase [Clostridia bacterium]